MSRTATVHLTAEELEAFDPLDYQDAEISYQRLRNVRVLRSGICLRNGLIVKGSIHKHPHLYLTFAKHAYGSWLKRRVAPTDPAKTYVAIHNIWSAGYYHWITESLARLRPVMHLLADATVLLPSNTGITEVMRRSLECFGVRDIEFFPPEDNVVVRDLILPENPPRHTEVSRTSVAFIRAHVLERVGDSRAPGGAREKIYVSRARSRGRKIANEDAVAAFLANRGYARVFLEELEFLDQARLMQRAEVVVAQHGAGLTNMMFMRPGTSVLELTRHAPDGTERGRGLNSKKLHPAYPRLASRVGVHYRCLLCRAADPRQRFDVGDIVVDLSALNEKLQVIEGAA